MGGMKRRRKGGKERERDKQRERDRERETDRETDRETERERQTKRERLVQAFGYVHACSIGEITSQTVFPNELFLDTYLQYTCRGQVMLGVCMMYRRE